MRQTETEWVIGMHPAVPQSGSASHSRQALQLGEQNDTPACPDCREGLLLQEGCIKCISCGYSVC